MPGAGIDCWLTACNLFADIKAKTEAALASLSKTKVDGFAWWQGESDASVGARKVYAAKFDQVMAKFKAEPWFAVDTPILIFGVSEYVSPYETSFKALNSILRSIVGREPENRRFVPTAIYPVPYWEPAVSNFHMTPDGYYYVGGDAAREWLGSFGQ